MANDGLVKSPFTITKTTDGVSWLSADLATSTDWKTILSYSVPLGMAVEISPVNYFFGFYYGTGGTTSGDKIIAGQTRILKSNANVTESREIWSGSNSIFKDVGDEFQRPKIRVPMMVNASQKILVQVYSMGTTLDKDNSDFNLEAIQYYEEV